MTNTNRNTSLLNVNNALSILGIKSTTNLTDVEITTAYRYAAAKYHPDRNPAGLEMMKLINVAYEILKAQDLSKITKASFAENYDYGETINKALNAIIALTGLSIEICGAWVWVGGNTKEHREILKQTGFLWSPKKNLWYFRPETHKSHNRGTWSMDEIRSIYGQKPVNSAEQKQLHKYN